VSVKAAILFCITICLVSGTTQPQSGGNANRSTQQNQNVALAKPVDWGTAPPARIFKDTEMKVNISLKTSWIPGEDHKGMFRYRMIAITDTPAIYSDQEIETLMNRVHSCSVFLVLQDVDGFQLRELMVPFGYGVDKDARLKSLYANTASQMDADEYRQFVGNSKQSGSWSISWDCGTTN
jgi:hypothetical protein